MKMSFALLFFLLAACAGENEPRIAAEPADATEAAAPAPIAKSDPPSTPPPPAPKEHTVVAEGATGKVDASCATSADCAVKDVGNCCGYFPACVNRDSPVFPEQVRAACEAEGRASICGFREISSCECVAGQCQAAGGGAPTAQ